MWSISYNVEPFLQTRPPADYFYLYFPSQSFLTPHAIGILSAHLADEETEAKSYLVTCVSGRGMALGYCVPLLHNALLQRTATDHLTMCRP